jgi:hypothetical protein
MVKAITLILLSLFSFSAYAKLSPIQVHSIKNGWHVPYSDETVKEVLGYPKVNIQEFQYDIPMYVPQSYWEEPVDKWMWALFWGLQLADIYSTHEGVKWDCMSEANPLLPEVPTIAEMATLKGAILLPTYGAIGYENITRAELVAPLLLGGFVVHHNLKLTRRAERRCNLR